MTSPAPQPATITDFMALIKAMQGAGAAAPDAPEAPTVTKELPRELMVDLAAFNAAKDMIKYANDQKDIAEEKIRAALDGADIGTVDGKEVVRVNASHNSHVDAGIVKTAFPEAYEAAYKRTDYTYLSVKR